MIKSLLFSALLPAIAAAGALESCPLVPRPESYSASGETLELAEPGAAVIALGADASEPEKYAAERLAGLIRKRFGVEYPVAHGAETPGAARQLVLLGRRESNAMLDRMCVERNIALSVDDPGHDGFAIEMFEDGGRDIILIGGSNPRGVIYGQDAFFDLLSSRGGAVEFPKVSVRDRPGIPWRSRPSARHPLSYWLTPGVFDAIVRARLNLINLTELPRGFPPAGPVPTELIQRILSEARRRDLFVYGTVSCSWKDTSGGVRWSGSEYWPSGDEDSHRAAVLARCEELIGLGFDGLWLSFNDDGAGPNWPELVNRALALARPRGMEGHRIAIVPPPDGYGNITDAFNRRGAALPGMESATWLFTRVPGAARSAEARDIGLKRPPAWWHNWPRLSKGGFLHRNYMYESRRPDGKPAYIEMQPLSEGWHSPGYDTLRDAAGHTDTVLMWGQGPDEYLAGAFGIWAWAPERHDWNATRLKVYSDVYGPAQAGIAMRFDDKLGELKQFFYFPTHEVPPGTPRFFRDAGMPRLKEPDDRETALRILGEMDTCAQTLNDRAPAGSLVDQPRLGELYLEPMRFTTAYAQRLAALDFPEYSFSEIEREIAGLVGAGDLAGAESKLRAAADRVEAQLNVIEREPGAANYAAAWRTYAGSGLYGFWLGARPDYIAEWDCFRMPEDVSWDDVDMEEMSLDTYAPDESSAGRTVLRSDESGRLELGGASAGAGHGRVALRAVLPAVSSGICRLYIGKWSGDLDRAAVFFNGEKMAPAADPLRAAAFDLNPAKGSNTLLVSGLVKPKTQMIILLSDPTTCLAGPDDAGNSVPASIQEHVYIFFR